MAKAPSLKRDRKPGTDAPAAFPMLLAGRRKTLFVRMLGNGMAQAALALALPFAILNSAQLPLPKATALLTLLALLLILLRVLELLDAESLGLDYVAQVRLALFDGLAAETTVSSHGVAMSRMMNDLAALKNWVGLGIARSCVALLSFAGCVAAVATMSPMHALAILLPALTIGLGALLSLLPLTQRVAEVRKVRGKLAALLGESLLALGVLKTFGQLSRHRKRVDRLSFSLNRLQLRRMRIAATWRALPEALLPSAVILALAAQVPLKAESLGFLLLVGLAVAPLRQALRALEYRATYAVARERLASGLGRRLTRPSPDLPAAPDDGSGLEVLHGPPDQVWRRIGANATLVTADAPLLRRSLRRNIDISGRHRGDDELVAEIAAFCGLFDDELFPQGLDSRLSPGRPFLAEGQRARLSLARALALGACALAVNTPVLLIDAEGRRLLRALPERFKVHVRLVAGDVTLEPGTPADGPAIGNDFERHAV
ncbi:MAG: hypothetical protein AAF495_06235 [Pseudomonadota bacterium]